jgi:hypothetical protein
MLRIDPSSDSSRAKERQELGIVYIRLKANIPGPDTIEEVTNPSKAI